MPKIKACKLSNLHKYTTQYKDVFTTDGSILFCKVCEKAVNSERKFLVDQHIKSQKHLELCDRKKGRATQTFLTDVDSDGIKQFSLDLCEAFLSADIPLAKLWNTNLRTFLKKYTNENIPCDNTLRKKYVDKLYHMQLQDIRTYLRNRYLWISIDETTDIEGRYIANVIVGILDKDEDICKKKFLLNVVELEKANHATIARTFHDSIKILEEEFSKDNILLFLTDAAPYMMKSAKALSIFYPKLIHVTCLAHALHRVADEVRSHFADIDLLISSGKKVFLKAPSRVAMLKEKYPGLGVPPQPVVTRWGSWLEAVDYYHNNFDDFKSAIMELDATESSSIKKIQELLNLSHIKSQLAFISSNYSFLSESITKLEGFGSLNDQIKLIDDAVTKIFHVEGNIAEKIKHKIQNVLDKNKGFEQIKEIAKTFKLDPDVPISPENNYSPNELSSFKYAPITSVDVERSFSMYKTFFVQTGTSHLKI